MESIATNEHDPGGLEVVKCDRCPDHLTVRSLYEQPTIGGGVVRGHKACVLAAPGVVIPPPLLEMHGVKRPHLFPGEPPRDLVPEQPGNQADLATLRPDYYGAATDDPYEVFKVIDAWGSSFYIGNVLKYVRRAGKKDPAKHIEDLEKAKVYLQHEIDLCRKAVA